MEVGQPSAPAPRAAREAAKAALETGRIGYTEALGIAAAARAHRPPLRGGLRGRRRAGAGRRHDRLVGRLRAGLPEPVRPRRAGRDHGAGLSRLSQHPGSARAGARRDPADRRPDGLDHDAPRPSSARTGTAARRRARHEPGQSVRHDDRPRRPGASSAKPADGSGFWFMSDEIYHGLTYAAPATTALASDDDAVVINSSRSTIA